MSIKWRTEQTGTKACFLGCVYTKRVLQNETSATCKRFFHCETRFRTFLFERFACLGFAPRIAKFIVLTLWHENLDYMILLNHKAHISRNFIPDSIFILFETFLAHFLNGSLQQIKKQFTITLKFRNKRLSKYYRQNTNATISQPL